jgi:pimeloyl-ACP methyl ester carboxylesterase
VTLQLERRVASVSGGQIAYADLGEGPPVLLLHGFPTNANLWRREAWLLAQRMRAIVPDLLGYGMSEKPSGTDLSEPAQGGYMKELLLSLKIEELAIVGHDIGGGVAQMLTLDGGLNVRALVLLDSVCFDAWPIEGVKMLQGATAEQESAEFMEELIRLTFDLGVHHTDRLEPDAVEAYIAPWRTDPPAFFRAARAITGRGLAGRDQELAALDIPTMLIWGEDDPFLGSELAERLGETIPGSTVALLPGCSHFVTEDAPQTVGPLIFEYLRSRYVGDAHDHGHRGGTAPVEVYLERPPNPMVFGADEDEDG